MSELSRQENKDSNFYNFFLEKQKSSYTFLNMRRLLYKIDCPRSISSWLAAACNVYSHFCSINYAVDCLLYFCVTLRLTVKMNQFEKFPLDSFSLYQIIDRLFYTAVLSSKISVKILWWNGKQKRLSKKY